MSVSMSQVLRQAWWAPLAGLLALALFAFAVVIGFSNSDDEAGAVIVGVILCLAGAFALGVGLWKRPQARVLGNALIIVGCLLAVFWFWTLVLPVAGIIVAVGVVGSEVRAGRGEPHAPSATAPPPAD